MSSGTVLFLRRNSSRQEQLAQLLEVAGFTVVQPAHATVAVDVLANTVFDVVLVDPHGDSLKLAEVIPNLRKKNPNAEVLILSKIRCFDTAQECVRLKIFDYLCEPLDLEVALRSVQHAVAKATRRRLQQGSLPPDAGQAMAVNEDNGFSKPLLLGESQVMKHLRMQIAFAAPHNINVLVQGETGTGKDLVARLIHAGSPRVKTGEWCKVNCPSIPENLFESEMFGYERGAFTGAQKQRLGRFELAHEGTIFLDEIGLLPLSIQAKLLEVLEYKSFYRIGGTKKVEVDTRVVTATNAPLEVMSKSGEFRSDLYYRLCVYTIDIPPLRERSEDIPLLLDSLMEKYAKRFHLPPRTIPPDLISKLMRYQWPGNVREMEGLVARYAVQGDSVVFEAAIAGQHREEGGALEAGLEQQEIQAIKTALAQTGWNQRKAAKLLRISYSALRRRLQKYAIRRQNLVVAMCLLSHYI